MQIKKNVSFFLGAGASRAFGFPTTEEFLEKIRNKWQGHELWDAALEIIPAINNKKVVDIEVILHELEDLEEYLNSLLQKKGFKQSYLLGENLFIKKYKDKTYDPENVKAFFQRHIGMINSLRNRIREEIYDTYWTEPESDEKYSETYKKLFSNFHNNVIDIFTTNYDLCIENTFRKDETLLTQFTDGFGRQYDDTIFKDKYTANFKYRLFKLHGSINWIKDPDQEDVIHKLNRRYPHPDLEYCSLLYPGTGIKNVKNFPFDKIYDRFGKHLANSDYCVIIGFSFRDEGINDTFRKALTDNGDLKYLNWNPNRPVIDFPDDRLITFTETFCEKHIEQFLDLLSEDIYMNSSERAIDEGRIDLKDMLDK